MSAQVDSYKVQILVWKIGSHLFLLWDLVSYKLFNETERTRRSLSSVEFLRDVMFVQCKVAGPLAIEN